MRKLRLKPPANDTRPMRRSLVELTAAASRAATDDVLMMPIFPIAAAVVDAPRPEDVANTSAPTAAPEQARASPVAESPSKPSPRKAAMPDTESTVEMLVRIAKDHQARTLDGIRLGLGAALDYAKDFAKTPVPADRGPPDGGATPDDKAFAAVGAAAAYRTEAIALAKANIATALDYARDLGDTTTAAEFVELSSALARKQCELMLRQATVLQSFARTVTKSADEEASMRKRLTRD